MLIMINHAERPQTSRRLEAAHLEARAQSERQRALAASGSIHFEGL
jgi:hypothetical protein